MKKILVLVVGLFLIGSAQAAMYFNDPFSYSPGTLGSSGSSGGWANSNSGVTVTNDSLDGTGLGLPASSGNKVATTTGSQSGTYNQFSAGIGSGSVYCSFLLRVDSTSGLTAGGMLLSGLLRNGSQSSYYVDTYLGVNGSDVEIGLAKLRGTVTWRTTPLTLGTTYFVVTKYQFGPNSGDDVVSLWVNPATGGSEPTADVSFSGGSDGNTSTGIGRCYIYGGTRVDLDEVRIGSTWEDVTPSNGNPPPPPPGPTNVVITAINILSGGQNNGDVELVGTGGVANASYEVETSGDASIPFTNWIPEGIHQFDPLGNFACTNGVTPGTLQRFFIIRVGGTNNLPATPPVIVSQPQDITNSAGTAATFTVGVSGSPPLFYQWYLNSITPLSGKTSSTLTLTDVQTGDSGGYSALVSNSVGSVTSVVAQLLVTNVFSAPSIITQPQSQTVVVSNNASFNVVATGTQPLFYQWYFNTNAPITDATNSTLQLSDVQFSDAGDYSVIVSNSLGTQPSAYATLTVNTNVTLNFNQVGYASYNFNLTGGSGGPTVDVYQLSDMSAYFVTDDNGTASSAPVVLRIHGTVTLRTNGDTYFGNNKTIIGVGTNAAVVGDIGLYWSTNVIIRNLDISNPGLYGEDDGISCKNYPAHIWVDHCTIHDTGDGHLDVTRGGDFVTVSWCKFYYTNPTGHEDVNLIGGDDGDSSSDMGRLHVTFHHNWWSSLCRERMISCRYGRAHVFNNYYNIGASDNYCNRTRLYAEMLVEGNWFENVKDPWELLTTSGTTGKVLAQYNNVSYLDTSYGVQWLNGWYSGQSLVPGTDTLTPASWNPASITDPDPSTVPPYAYTLDNAADVPGIVTNNCGNGKGPFAP